MTLLEDIEELGILPEGDDGVADDVIPEHRRTFASREAARTRLIARNKALSFEHPRVGTHAARILSVLKHGTQGTAQIAKAVFGKTKDHALELRRVQSTSSILGRLQRRGFVKRTGFARWSLAARGLPEAKP